jgi:glycosyltransferase involved in cell wall biosynthesis
MDNAFDPSLTALEFNLASAAFSPRFYVIALPWLTGKSISEKLHHFLTIGIHETLSPSPLFDPLIYEHRSLLIGYKLTESEKPSFFHWLRYGMARHIVPSALFDETYYQLANPDVAETGKSGFVHFLLSGMQEGRAPNATFDVATTSDAIVAEGGRSWNLIDAHVQLHGLEPEISSMPLMTMDEQAAFNIGLGAAPAEQGESGGYTLAWRWRAGIALDAGKSDNQLDPYFNSISNKGASVLSWAKLVSSCWPHPESKADLNSAVARVRASGLFDAAFYRARAGLDKGNLDPAIHYVLVGEALGLMPSEGFDPAYYAKRYPDVMRAGLILLLHYVDYGRAEGRHSRMPPVSHANPRRFDRTRKNVIVVVHESSRTGAPILGWNIARTLAKHHNVFIVLLDGGPLTPEFEALSVETYGPFLRTQRGAVDLEHGLRPLFENREFRYAIINSTECRHCVEVCARQFVPTLFLVHEFGTYVQPAAELRRAFDWASEIVFPAPTVARSSETVHPALKARPIRILPQGMSIVPAGNSQSKPPPIVQWEALSRARAGGMFFVLGAGSVQLRKGVDIFLATAAAVIGRNISTRPIHFLWVGHGYSPVKDMGYSVYLKEQLQRSGLERHVTFLNEVSDLEPIYALADIFLLSSRLDPLPNVSIDAAHRGIPIICFRDASGTADLMLGDPLTAVGVVPHLDAEAAGRVITHLSSDETARQKMAQATANLARAIFNMEHYVAHLDALGVLHDAQAAQKRADAETILLDESFDQDLFLGAEPIIESRALTVARYLIPASGAPEVPVAQVLDNDEEGEEQEIKQKLRRPAPGFDPRLWVAIHPDRMHGGEDPFADFIRAGRPPGRWQSPLLRPPTDQTALATGGIRAVLHAHLLDPSLAVDLLNHIRLNVLGCDLLVTTDTDIRALQIRRAVANYRRGAVRVDIIGKDPISWVAYLATNVADYDVIGHVTAVPDHGSHVWHEFQWQALLGGRHAMCDCILDAFARSSTLGAVFPADPYLATWNDVVRNQVAMFTTRLGVAGQQSEGGDFPVGGMLWMRSALLRILSDLGSVDRVEKDHSDDMVTALQRAVPLAAESAGLSYAVAHVPGVFW